EYKLPQAVIDIIVQHHGTTVVSYFYHKAKEERGEEVNPDDFRYPGPKPQTKEAAIVMLADSIEASARSLSEFTPSKLESLVREVIKMKIEDGQLSESPLSFKDLEKIVYAFIKVLRGMYHSRIEYPEGGKEIEGFNKRSKEVAKEGGPIAEGSKGNGS
ncbi:MAG: phosphohydrolase, partial [Synergistetes bacterium]|nr:phosphohydrolase [Synergistota bacterium]MDW8191812.1 phosphohydrolase [Synergistota bacterium]